MTDMGLASSQADGAVGPGVLVTPPHLINDAIKGAVASVLAHVPADKTIAFVAIGTKSGGNLAIAYRPLHDDRFTVAAWIGKSGWEQPLGGGVYLQAAF